LFLAWPGFWNLNKLADKRTTMIPILVEPETFSEIIADDMDQIHRDLQRLVDIKTESQGLP